MEKILEVLPNWTIVSLFIIFLLVLILISILLIYSITSGREVKIGPFSIGKNENKKDDFKNNLFLQNREQRDKKIGTLYTRIFNAEHEIWMSGTTLNLSKSGILKGIEKTKIKIKILLPDYEDSSTLKLISEIDKRDIKEEKNSIISSISYFQQLKEVGANIEIKLLKYSPSISFFASDVRYNLKDKSFMSIELTGYNYNPSKTVNFTVFAKDESNLNTYNYFLSMWEEMWNNAKLIE